MMKCLLEADVELADIREQFRVTKTENEFLREKNETLFKLGRMALEKKKEPELEIIEDNDEDGLDALVNSTVNYKKASFRRAGPEKTNQQSELFQKMWSKINLTPPPKWLIKERTMRNIAISSVILEVVTLRKRLVENANFPTKMLRSANMMATVIAKSVCFRTGSR